MALMGMLLVRAALRTGRPPARPSPSTCSVTAGTVGVAADAGIAGVAPQELVRRNFVPVMTGVLVACVVAVFIML